MAVERRTTLAQNLAEVKAKIPPGIHLIVVTKTFTLSDAQILHELGVSEFGENRDQEGKEKAPLVPGKWHFQGQLQSNKLKSICSWADVIQTIDTERYVELVSKASNKTIEVFIQVSLDGELHRGGALPENLPKIADKIIVEDRIDQIPVLHVDAAEVTVLELLDILDRGEAGVLVMNEPTRGIDVGARADIYRIMREFCAQGHGLVVASSDLEEIVGLGDIVITMYRGRQVGMYTRDEVTMHRVVADITHPLEQAS